MNAPRAHDKCRLICREPIRFESGTEGTVAWLDGPRAIPIYVAGSGPKMLTAAGRLGGYGGYEILKRSLLTAEGVTVSGSRVCDLGRVAWRGR